MPNRFFDLFNETDKDRVIDVDVDNIQPSRYQPRLIGSTAGTGSFHSPEWIDSADYRTQGG